MSRSSTPLRLHGVIFAAVLLGWPPPSHGTQVAPNPIVSTAGTGGISIESPSGSWGAPASGLPHVVITPKGFDIRTSSGQTISIPTGDPMKDRFFQLWWDLHNPQNGYFSARDVPFHSIETLIVEAPDYGHLTTSEGFSYWAWLEAIFARYTGDYSLLRYVFDRIERYAIPGVQPTVGNYNPSSPASYARENPSPAQYPSPLESSVPVGRDPLAAELRSAYGDRIYGMHWLIDTENWYGYGIGREPTFINTFQRGAQESVWETIPHPSIDDLRFGAPNQGYLSLFTRDDGGYKAQWRYTNAPDADARLVQAAYWAQLQAKADQVDISDLTAKATKMGDFLRYSMFDKYFKRISCQSTACPAGQGYDSAHYLLSWYYAWGGSLPQPGSGDWSWRIGSSHAHFGYQNPVAAYVLSAEPEFRPKTASGARDWSISLKRQLEFYRWLQSAEGAIAGGATSSWQGSYQPYPEFSSSFYGLAYDPHPVYLDPPSNSWFGWQAWSMQRVAEYYYISGDRSVEPLLDKWVAWVQSVVQLLPKGEFAIPVSISWEGQPDTWNPLKPSDNPNLRVTVLEWNQDVGITSALAKTLMQYAAATSQHRLYEPQGVRELSRELIDRIWNRFRTSKGLATPEVRKDYQRFLDPVYVPSSYQGRMPSGATINSQSTFLSLRPQYRNDPSFQAVQAYLNSGEAPVFYYHRFWAQVEAALAYAEYDMLFAD